MSFWQAMGPEYTEVAGIRCAVLHTNGPCPGYPHAQGNGGITMTDDQAKTPKPGEPEPAPPVEETEPALEEADTTTTTTTTETTTEDPA